MLLRMRIALCTCASLSASEADAPLHRALRERGVDVAQPVWDDPAVDWAAFDAALIRTTWDYQERREDFVAWALRTAARTRLFNPAPVVAWNTHKSYLRDLATRGVPIADTEWLRRGSSVDLSAVLGARGWAHAFLKPCVGATARETLRFAADGPGIARAQAHVDRLLPREDLMLQQERSALAAALAANTPRPQPRLRWADGRAGSRETDLITCIADHPEGLVDADQRGRSAAPLPFLANIRP